ncbi:MAG: biotin transporter BioY [Firmicutes bacterium]|nr:biotin transporter BioY [Bacillota bacterium]
MNKDDLRMMIVSAMFSVLIAVGGFIKIPFPAVPMTLQPFFTTLAGLLLGGKWGARSVLIYILMGLAGIPVFTKGGGISYVLEPTFGYLTGFFFGTYLTGTIAHKEKEPGMKRLLIACFAGLAVIYALGMIYLYVMMNYFLGTEMGVKAVIVSGFLTTIPKDVIVSIICAAIAKKAIPVIRTNFEWVK